MVASSLHHPEESSPLTLSRVTPAVVPVLSLGWDEHLDLLDNDDFPGSVLLQLGVGTQAEWDVAQQVETPTDAR